MHRARPRDARLGADPAALRAPRLVNPGPASSKSPEIAINARAASRAQIGGVERLCREMVDRLPLCEPGRYRVIAPPAGMAHRIGHAWEQLALPLLARGARLLYSPANLAPLRFDRNVVVIHDAAALRHPDAYSRVYVAYQRALLPASRAARGS